MNETQKKLAAKVGRLTKNLELGVVADTSRSDIENARAASDLFALCEKLATIMPHATFSADERVERFARVVEGATPNPDYLEPEIVKLERLTARIHELLPDPDLSLDEKVDLLGARYTARVNAAGQVG